MIELRILGQIALKGLDGAELTGLLRQPKRMALLAYLASPAPGTWHRRDLLLALFWPELDTAHARMSLRNSIYVLRQFLGEDVVRNRGDDEIAIDADKLTTDLAAVWSALKSNDIEQALASYGGDLLPGLYPPDSEGFERWLESERTRLRVAISTAAMAHVDALEKSGNAARALAAARKVAEINPEDETIVRRVMALHEKIGDRAGGLAAFESYRSRLQRDFEAEPARETIEAANRLRTSTSGFLAPGAPPIVRKVFEPGAEPAATIGASSAPVTRRSYRPVTIAFSVILLAVAATVAWSVTRSPTPASIGRSTPLTSDEGLQVEPAISPSGRLIAYAKGNPAHLRIFVQPVSGGPAWPLTGDTTQVELMPRWSPDNNEILFLARNNAYASPTNGGTPRLIARGTEGDGVIRSASWSPDGDSVAIVRHDSLMVIPSRGGSARLIGTGFQLHSCVWSPDSRWIACVSGNWIAFTPGPLFLNDAPSTIVLFPVAGGDGLTLTKKDFESESPSWSTDGRFLWMLSNRDGVPGEAYAVPIGADGREAGKYVRAGIRAEFISLSANRIAYSEPTKKANLWTLQVPRNGTVKVGAAERLTKENQVIELESVSRDGKWIVFDSNLSGNSDIYRMPIGGGRVERLTSDPRQEFAAEISPDGREMAWQRYVRGVRHLFVRKIDSDEEHELLPDFGDHGVPRWSPDGKTLLAWSHDNERGGVFVLRRDENGKWSRPLWRLDYGIVPVWSPDGRDIAFTMLDGSVRAISVDSGEVRTLYAPKSAKDPQATYLIWDRPEEMWMLAIWGSGQDIWRLSLADGKIRRVVTVDDPVGNFIGPSIAGTKDRFYFAVIERTSNIKWAELVH